MSKKLTVSISNEKIAWCVLLSILILAGMVRYRLLNVPLERDEGEYAYAAQLILQGVPPYQSVYSIKLPGTYLAYAAFLILTLVISSCLGLSIYQNREFLFSMTPLQISRKTYGLNPFPESLQVAEFIKNFTRQGDRIAVLGSEFLFPATRCQQLYLHVSADGNAQICGGCDGAAPFDFLDSRI